MNSQIKKGNIVQVINNKHHWFPSLVIVDEVISFGIMGYTHIPKKGDAYIRLNIEDYEIVGNAIIITA